MQDGLPEGQELGNGRMCLERSHLEWRSPRAGPDGSPKRAHNVPGNIVDSDPLHFVCETGTGKLTEKKRRSASPEDQEVEPWQARPAQGCHCAVLTCNLRLHRDVGRFRAAWQTRFRVQVLAIRHANMFISYIEPKSYRVL